MRIPGLGLDLADEAVPWRSTSYPGIYWFALHHGPGEGPQDTTVLIRMDPGRGYPAHRHVGVEEVLVIRGGYRDEFGIHEAGCYVRYDAGSIHSPVAIGDAAQPPSSSNPSCVLFSVAHGGVRLESARGREN
jgi:anti-sigma factor ChrR (cupin superfamily)